MTDEMPVPPVAAPVAPQADMPAPRNLAVQEPSSPPPEAERDLEVVRDAVRLLGWGREWHELPEAIARMAGRPDKLRVRGILQLHRDAIERQASAGSRTH